MPTFEFMLLTSPGNASGTETIIAAAARQFCEPHGTGFTTHIYGTICIPIPSMRPIHRGNFDMGAVYEPILSGKAAIEFGIPC
jgi:hypothetical protein